jgi:hypothetical protein
VLTTFEVTGHALGISDLTFYGSVLITLGLLIALIPITVPLISMILLPVYVCARLLCRTWFTRYDFRKPGFYLRIPLDPRSYRGLDGSTFVWGLLYYFGYTLSAGCWIVLFFSLVFVVAWQLLGSHVTSPGLSVRFHAYLALLALSAITRIVFFPYVCLLISSVKMLSPLMHRYEYCDLEKMIFGLANKQKGSETNVSAGSSDKNAWAFCVRFYDARRDHARRCRICAVCQAS